jgi:hypothetical protein
VDFGPLRDVAGIPRTDITPHAGVAIQPDRNAIYCATFQIAWDDFRNRLNGASIRLEGDPPLADELNQRMFSRDSLADDCYIALVAMPDEIPALVQVTFPHVQPQLTHYLGHVFTCYAYLEKSMPFEEEFERLPTALRFNTAEGPRSVAAFGVLESRDPGLGLPILREQLTVLDYVSDDDFVLRLETIGPQRDEIVLAKIAPQGTLEETLRVVRERIAAPHRHHNRRNLTTAEPLAIPLLLLNVRRHYRELEDRGVTNAPGHIVGDARQDIRLRLDETGAHLISEAEIPVYASLDDAQPPPPPRPRKFLIDRPFLLILQERDAMEPYFAAWIANTELMQPFSAP